MSMSSNDNNRHTYNTDLCHMYLLKLSNPIEYQHVQPWVHSDYEASRIHKNQLWAASAMDYFNASSWCRTLPLAWSQEMSNLLFW